MKCGVDSQRLPEPAAVEHDSWTDTAIKTVCSVIIESCERLTIARISFLKTIHIALLCLLSFT